MRSLKDIIRNDSSIMDNTVIGYCSGYEKQSILGGQVFCISSLLASVIYYACIEVKNSDCAEAISKRSIASTCSSTPFSAIIVSHDTESKKLSTQLF